jgi:hypothetical protein
MSEINSEGVCVCVLGGGGKGSEKTARQDNTDHRRRNVGKGHGSREGKEE